LKLKVILAIIDKATVMVDVSFVHHSARDMDTSATTYDAHPGGYADRKFR
jgi:hypothetical protein